MSLNTDNRLMSHTTLTARSRPACGEALLGWILPDLERLSVNAMNAAFYPYAERKRVVLERILPWVCQSAAWGINNDDRIRP